MSGMEMPAGPDYPGPSPRSEWGYKVEGSPRVFRLDGWGEKRARNAVQNANETPSFDIDSGEPRPGKVHMLMRRVPPGDWVEA